MLAQVDQWRGFLTSEPDVAGTRQFMRELLKGPLTFTPLPEQKAHRIEGGGVTGAPVRSGGASTLRGAPKGNLSGGSWVFHDRRCVQLMRWNPDYDGNEPE